MRNRVRHDLAARPAGKFPICSTTERYRAGQGRNDYTYLAHDLAARPAGKFLFSGFLSQADMHIFRYEKGSPPAALSVYFSLTAVP